MNEGFGYFYHDGLTTKQFQHRSQDDDAKNVV